MMDGYTPLVPGVEFEVREIFSVHYFEYARDYVFPGEAHGFWEFCYVDKGEISITADKREITLKKGQAIFHKPYEYHALQANGAVAPNLVVASFSSQSPNMRWFEDKILYFGDEEREWMARIINEASSAFLSPLDDPELKQLVRRASTPPGAEQMIKISLEAILICLYRKGRSVKDMAQQPTSLIREKTRRDFVDNVLAYLEKNLNSRLTLEEVCRDNIVGRSYLQKVFREKTGGGVMEYFGRMKIEAAKQMIREGRHNFTEIAGELGYTSIHYFSRHFKKVTGMTPSEYASSVKALTGRSKIV